ncbi:hypothetical protein BX666DRAFT_1934551 [Dichotomocladium elegans]|nr:hypothetical protein BX666DRAFT_1934551 [Dichotomocladium elegans]
MYMSSHSTKRFPTACRFFSQGNCRAGDNCLFAHILPIKGTPSNTAHAVVFGDALDESPVPLQKAICDIELDQLEKKYNVTVHHSSKPHDTHSVVTINMPLQDTQSGIFALHLDLFIPINYPDSQCTIRILNPDLAEDQKRSIEKEFQAQSSHQQRRIPLVQQLDWLSSRIADLASK